MDCITFEDVTFTYPPTPGDVDAEGKQIEPPPVFAHFSGAIPAGGGAMLTSLIGPNGTGKTTFLLLASGRLAPQKGRCTLFGEQAAFLSEERRSRLASVIYQNMEFESQDTVGHLLRFVYQSGTFAGRAQAVRPEGTDLLDEVEGVFELGAVLERGLTALSKGELQRVLLAFSILYGSRAVFMDEPMFAMEERQKQSALAYLKEFAARTGTALFVSMHELDLTRRFADRVLLFYPNRDMDYGTPEEVLTSEALEKAYGVPAAFLKHSEDMTREGLRQAGETLQQLARQGL